MVFHFDDGFLLLTVRRCRGYGHTGPARGHPGVTEAIVSYFTEGLVPGVTRDPVPSNHWPPEGKGLIPAVVFHKLFKNGPRVVAQLLAQGQLSVLGPRDLRQLGGRQLVAGGCRQLGYGRLVVEVLGPDGHHGVVLTLGVLLLHKLFVDVDLAGQLVLQLCKLDVGPTPLGLELS